MWTGRRLARLLAPLRARAFRLLVSAQSISLAGDNFTSVVLAFAVLDLTGSAADLGLVLAARTVPLVVLVLAGGVWADRLPRQRRMVAANLGRYASQGLLAGQAGQRVGAAVAAGGAHGRARHRGGVLLPGVDRAGPPDRPRPRACNTPTRCCGWPPAPPRASGPRSPGALLAATSPGWAIALDAFSFAVSALLLARLRPAGRVRVGEERGFARELAAGWREVGARSWLGATIT